LPVPAPLKKEPTMPFLREPSHILLLLIVVTVLFGAKRLPDSARSLGRSMRIFKSEMKEMKSDEPGTTGKNEDSSEK
jgi:sec-independent protein translocase protein TatA